MSSLEPRSLAATKSMSAPRCLAARKKLRPMRPNPLMPTRMLMCWRAPVPGVVERGPSEQIGPVRFQSGAGRSAYFSMSRCSTTGSRLAGPQELGHRLGDHHRPVPAAGAAEGDGEVGLALGHVGREQQVEEPLEVLEELAGGRLAEHVVAHRRRRGRSAGAAPPPSAGWAGTGSRAPRRRRPGGRACSRRTRRGSASRRRGRPPRRARRCGRGARGR